MKKAFIFILLAFAISGCITKPTVESTKPWEGHYYSANELKEKVDTIQLDKDESMWLMSNHTLNRLLKNTRK